MSTYSTGHNPVSLALTKGYDVLEIIHRGASWSVDKPAETYLTWYATVYSSAVGS